MKPIVLPAIPSSRRIPIIPWEDLAVFNPAAWYDETSKEVLLLYRTAESGPEYKCWFGLAKSRDGFHFERVSDQPALSPSVEGYDGATIQDPRITKTGDWFYVTYACRHFPFGQFWIPEVRQRFVKPECPPEFPHYLRTNATLTALAMTRDFKSWIRAGWITDPLLDDTATRSCSQEDRREILAAASPLEWVGPRYGTEQACAWIKCADDLLGLPAAPSRLLLKQRLTRGKSSSSASTRRPSRRRTAGSRSTTRSARTNTTASARCCWTSTIRASCGIARPTG